MTSKDRDSHTLESAFWPWMSTASAGVTLDDEAIQRISKIGSKRFYRKGSIITGHGEAVSGVFFLSRGEVTGRFFSADGLEKTVFIFKPPCFFDESPYLAGCKSTMEISASVDSELAFINQNTLENLLASDPAFSRMLMKHMAKKTQLILDQLTDMLSLPPLDRIHKVLIAYANEQGIPTAEGIAIRITHEQVANITGLHRVTVTKALGKMKDSGVIKKTSKSLVVLDPNNAL